MTDFNKEEAKMAKADGLRPVANSGRGFKKGDAKGESTLVDYKFISGKSFSLNIDKFEKHYKDAWREQREGVIVAVFEGRRRVAMVDFDWLKELMNDNL